MGDRMQLWVYGKLATPEDDDKRHAILAQIKAIEPFGGADRVAADTFSDQNWGGVVYKYEGRTGKEVEQASLRFIRKDAEGFLAKVRKIYRNGL